MAKRLNLGAGDTELNGFTPIDLQNGDKVWPLDAADDSVDEIYASHILEHFSHRHTLDVLRDWVRALKPGGHIRIAVPDYKKIIEYSQSDEEFPVESWLLGAHSNNQDVHLALFTEAKLRTLMEVAGLENVQPWAAVLEDDASLPCSLNLQGAKPAAAATAPKEAPPLRVRACMSVPRLGFMDNFFCAFNALVPLQIPLRRQQGAFWGQCLTRAIEFSLADGCDAILALDYDTLYTREDVATLVHLLAEHPEVDAIAPIQSSRTRGLPLMTVADENGNGKRELPVDDLYHKDLIPITTAHFGCTIIRASVFDKIAKPWFAGTPGPDGRWDDKRTDPDIHFWRRMDEAGLQLYQANRVIIGHAELMIRWPGRDLNVIHQHPSQFYEHGKPEKSWR